MTTTKMLINAQRAEQLRVAIVEDGILTDFQVEIADRGLCRGNIYRGVVANVQPSLGAAFIDIGEERHGFLPVADVVAAAYHRQPKDKSRRPKIDEVLERGRPILVQVTKDGVGQKGPALTTNLALAGRYLVLTPFDEVRGISRKAEDDKERKKIRERLKKLSLPDTCGVIVRTNGLEQNQTTLNRDLNALLRLWKRVRAEANKGQGSRLLYSDQDLVVQALRDYLDNNISEVLVDDDEAHEKAEAYMRAFMPRSKTRLVRYRDRLPLFSRHRLETQIDRIYERSVPLPSGGSLVIDATEALTAIDVNSGRATRNSDHDESILQVNLEAAREVARQLRLRDIGGLMVVDFIDMRLRKHQSKVEKAMRDAMKDDRARYSVGRISPNGLLEINRQRIKQALRLRTHRSCPTCQGVGMVGTSEFAALKYLRRIEARAMTGHVEAVTLALHPEIADALQNFYRARLAELEQELGLRIEILSATHLKRSEDRIDWKEREGGAAPLPERSAALTATDLAPPGDRDRRKPKDTEASTDESPTSGGKTRKRKRRRKSGSRVEAVTADGERTGGDSAQSEGPSHPETKDGGEGRKPEHRALEKDDSAAKRDKSREAKSDDSKGNGADQAEGGAPKPRRRRRGGRRRKKSQAANAPGEAQQRAQTHDEESQPPPNYSHETSSLVSEPARSRQRRSRKRKKPAAAAGAGDNLGNRAPAHLPRPNDGEGKGPSPPLTGGSEKLRWQWWGGDDDVSPGTAGARDSDSDSSQRPADGDA